MSFEKVAETFPRRRLGNWLLTQKSQQTVGLIGQQAVAQLAKEAVSQLLTNEKSKLFQNCSSTYF